MEQIKVFWHNLNKCLKYWENAKKQGCLIRMADITEAFYNKGFYDCIMFFNSDKSFKAFCLNNSIIDFEYKRAV